jgi:cell shape-determining protein MreD
MNYIPRGLLIIVLGVLGILFQGTVLKMFFGINFFVPHLLLMLAVLLAFIEPNPFGAIMCFLLGILSDFSRFVVVFLSSLVASIVYLGLELQFKQIDSSVFSLSWSLLLEAFVTACIAPLLFPFVGSFLQTRAVSSVRG